MQKEPRQDHGAAPHSDKCYPTTAAQIFHCSAPAWGKHIRRSASSKAHASP